MAREYVDRYYPGLRAGTAAWASLASGVGTGIELFFNRSTLPCRTSEWYTLSLYCTVLVYTLVWNSIVYTGVYTAGGGGDR